MDCDMGYDGENAALSKIKLRNIVLREHFSRSPDMRKKSDELLFGNLFSLPEYISAESIFIFVGMYWEPETEIVIKKALSEGKTVAVPRCGRGGAMDARIINSFEELSEGRFSIPEPSSQNEVLENPDLIIVPALCYDKKGNRLGRGGGFYDRYLKEHKSFSIGLCRDFMLRNDIPTESRDVPVSALITENGVIRTGLSG